jgi:hypothetical protein
MHVCCIKCRCMKAVARACDEQQAVWRGRGRSGATLGFSLAPMPHRLTLRGRCAPGNGAWPSHQVAGSARRGRSAWERRCRKRGPEQAEYRQTLDVAPAGDFAVSSCLANGYASAVGLVAHFDVVGHHAGKAMAMLVLLSAWQHAFASLAVLAVR